MPERPQSCAGLLGSLNRTDRETVLSFISASCRPMEGNGDPTDRLALSLALKAAARQTDA